MMAQQLHLIGPFSENFRLGSSPGHTDTRSRAEAVRLVRKELQELSSAYPIQDFEYLVYDRCYCDDALGNDPEACYQSNHMYPRGKYRVGRADSVVWEDL